HKALRTVLPSGTKPTQNALRPPRIIDSDDDEPLFDDNRAARPGTLPSVPKPEVRARASGEATRKGPPPTPPPASRVKAPPAASPLVSSSSSSSSVPRPPAPAEPTRATPAAPGSSTQLSSAGSASGF